MQSKYVTWYVHHHLAPLISISKVLPWSLSSPARHHDLHHLDLYQCVITWSSHQLLLLQLLLSHSDKVKQLFGACILCNKETTIRLLPVADNFNKTWSSHTTIYISSRLDHITSQQALQKQVRCPLLCFCKFTWLPALSKNRSYLHIKTTTIFRQVCCFNLQQGPGVATLDSTKVGETDTRQPPVCEARR